MLLVLIDPLSFMILEARLQFKKLHFQINLCVFHSIQFNQLILQLEVMMPTATPLIWERWIRQKLSIKIILVLLVILTILQREDSLFQDLLIELLESLTMIQVEAKKFITLKECKSLVVFNILLMDTIYSPVAFSLFRVLRHEC